MRLICIFKGDKLLEQSDFFHESTVGQFKENVSNQTGIPLNELEAVMFEDADIDAYIGGGSRKSVKISKSSVKLVDLVDIEVPITTHLRWQNCDSNTIFDSFTVEDQAKITQNKTYYNSLGNEKFQPGFAFNWPHEVIGPLVDAIGTDTVDSVFKEVTGQII